MSASTSVNASITMSGGDFSFFWPCCASNAITRTRVSMGCSPFRNDVFTTKIRFQSFKGHPWNVYSLYSGVSLLHIQGHREIKSCIGFECECMCVIHVYINLQVLDWTGLVADAGHQVGRVQCHLRYAVCCRDAAQSQITAGRRVRLQSLWPRRQRPRQELSGFL